MREPANIILYRGKSWDGEMIPDVLFSDYYFDLTNVEFTEDDYNRIKKNHSQVVIILPYSSPNNLCWNPEQIVTLAGMTKVLSQICPPKSRRHDYRNSLLNIVPKFLWKTDCTFILKEYHEITRTLLYYEILWMIHDLEEKKGVDPERFILSDCNIITEDKRPKFFYTSFPYLKKRIRSKGFNHFEILTSFYFERDDIRPGTDYDLTKKRKKKFLFLNRRAREHRDSLILKIVRKGFLFTEDNFYFSFIFPDALEIDKREIRKEELNRVRDFIDGIPHILDTGGKNPKDKIRLALSQAIGPTSDTPQILNYFQDSYFNLITESLPVKDLIFLTEKTFKCFAWKQPFILLGNSGSLQKLQEMGYKTFRPWINEEYDKIIDVDLRTEAVYQETKRICEMSLEEVHNMYQEIIPIINYNYDHFAHQKVLKRNYDYAIREFLNPNPPA